MSRLTGKRMVLIGAVLSAGLGAGVAVAVQASASGSPSAPTPPAPPKPGTVTPALKVQPHALATNVHCGQIVTATVTLNGDLICSGSGLTVNANSITVNLGGHSIFGPGDNVSIGVTLNGTSDKVTNGNLVAFRTGVQLQGTSETASSIRAVGNFDGIVVIGGKDIVTTSQALANTQFGIAVAGTGDSVTTNKAISNQYGIYISGMTEVVTGNSASSNSLYGVYDAGTGNKIATNVTNFNGSTGILAADYAVIDGGGNTAKGNNTTGASFVLVTGEQCYEIACT